MTNEKRENEWASIDEKNAHTLSLAPEQIRPHARRAINMITDVARRLEKGANVAADDCPCGRDHQVCSPRDAMTITGALFSLLQRFGGEETANILHETARYANRKRSAKRKVSRKATRTKKAKKYRPAEAYRRAKR